MTAPELAGFLLARIAEDKAVANEAIIASWDAESPFRTVIGVMSSERLLAECEAKRKIVTLHTPRRTTRAEHEEAGYTSCPICDPYPPMDDPDPGPCTTLRLLALPYSSHPAYRPEWKS